jgi:hypothetical protein
VPFFSDRRRDAAIDVGTATRASSRCTFVQTRVAFTVRRPRRNRCAPRAKAFSQPRESVSRSRRGRKRFTETSHRVGILESVPINAGESSMRRIAVVAVLSCTVACVAACSDDAAHEPQAADATQQAGANAGAANAFNGGPAANAGAAASSSDAAPLAPPVVHYPPDDDDAKPAPNAADPGAAPAGSDAAAAAAAH